jgi:hypothetical protein
MENKRPEDITYTDVVKNFNASEAALIPVTSLAVAGYVAYTSMHRFMATSRLACCLFVHSSECGTLKGGHNVLMEIRWLE